MIVVKILKKHTEGTHYMSNLDCPLARALKEQYPELGVPAVGGDGVTFYAETAYKGKYTSAYRFPGKDWSGNQMRELMDGNITEVQLELTENVFYEDSI